MCPNLVKFFTSDLLDQFANIFKLLPGAENFGAAAVRRQTKDDPEDGTVSDAFKAVAYVLYELKLAHVEALS